MRSRRISFCRCHLGYNRIVRFAAQGLSKSIAKNASCAQSLDSGAEAVAEGIPFADPSKWLLSIPTIRGRIDENAVWYIQNYDICLINTLYSIICNSRHASQCSPMPLKFTFSPFALQTEFPASHRHLHHHRPPPPHN